MKVLAINGSPRKKGNCHHLSNYIKEKFQADFIELEEVFLNPNSLKGCISCFKCFEMQNGQCAIKDDDFNGIQEKLIEADGLILLSPVYTGSVSAAMKAFIEKSSLVSMACGGLFDRKPAAAIAVARRAGTLSTLEPMHHYMNITGMISVGSTYWNILYGGRQGECLKDQEGMETLDNLILNFTWLMKTINQSSLPQPETYRIKATNFIREDL